jgi:hypothetical protein
MPSLHPVVHPRALHAGSVIAALVTAAQAAFSKYPCSAPSVRTRITMDGMQAWGP